MNTPNTKNDNAHAAARFERLYRETYGLVYNYLSYRANDPDIAEDIAAEAFLKAARAFDRFDPARAKFSTWVVSIARNCLIDYWKKERPTSTLENLPESVLAVEDELATSENVLYLNKLLAKLDELERELVFMKYYEGKRNAEIARELNMNPSTVATKLQRALLSMRAAAKGGW